MTLERWGDVARLADTQWGLFTTAQAQQRGLTRASLGRWAQALVVEQIAHGVYAFPGATDSPLIYDRALWLSLSPGSSVDERLADPVSSGVLSHTTAARLHQVGNLLDSRTTITLPQPRRVRRVDVDVRSADLDPSDVELVDGLPVTTPVRTVRDLIAAGTDLDQVADVLDDARRRRFFSLEDLMAAIAPIAPARGFADGEDLLAYLLSFADTTVAAR